jgi:DUF971 family protein
MSDQPTGDQNVSPTALARDGDAAILITWSDGKTTRWSATQLRQACPCASCRDQRKADTESTAAAPAALPVLSAAEARPLKIESMRPVGVYAYNIAFSDGHSSGIFPFPMLYGEAE